LVERIKGLKNVSVKNVPYLSSSGMVVSIPGPFSLVKDPSPSSIDSSTAVTTPEKNDVFDLQGFDSSLPRVSEAEEDDFDDDTEEDDDFEEEEEEVPETEEITDSSSSALARHHSDPEKFVVRNEFGHIRIQHLLDILEQFSYGNTLANTHFNMDAMEIGGHCVLPKSFYDHSILKGWGKQHVFAGRYHPIVGTMIPETTLMFYAPRNETELEIVWNIIVQSYQWALLSDEKN
jgi:hypothetical protein